MRHLAEFSALEWLQLLPLQHALKQVRNDTWLALYKTKRPPELPRFLTQYKNLAGKNVALVIAFEQPWALNWLLRMANRNLSDATVLVFDNSRNAAKRIEIERVCHQNNVAYLGLPANQTRHVNRSHGMAMTWVYHQVIREIKPRIFGFIDHDLIPVRKVSIDDKLAGQPVYGLLNQSKFGFWSPWAGYCFFDYASTAGKALNFLYDFSRDLDTGGRNWKILYSGLDRQKLRAAISEDVSVKVPTIPEPRLAQFVDQHWLHIGGVGYKKHSSENLEFFKGLENVFDKETP